MGAKGTMSGIQYTIKKAVNIKGVLKHACGKKDRGSKTTPPASPQFANSGVKTNVNIYTTHFKWGSTSLVLTLPKGVHSELHTCATKNNVHCIRIWKYCALI